MSRLPGPLAFVEDLDEPVLAPEDQHHLEKALRVAAGDRVVLSDGRGSWREFRFGRPPQPDGPIVTEPPPQPELAVAFALVKGARPQVIAQKLTELGIDRIVPFVAERSVVRWPTDRVDHHVRRLARVCREAAMQSRRCRLPEVSPPVSFAEVSRLPGAALTDPDGDPPSLANTLLLVGPEGGWSEAELAAGLPRVALGGAVLRAETAAIAAGVLLGCLREGLLGPGGDGG